MQMRTGEGPHRSSAASPKSDRFLPLFFIRRFIYFFIFLAFVSYARACASLFAGLFFRSLFLFSLDPFHVTNKTSRQGALSIVKLQLFFLIFGFPLCGLFCFRIRWKILNATRTMALTSNWSRGIHASRADAKRIVIAAFLIRRRSECWPAPARVIGTNESPTSMPRLRGEKK